ncbi:putative disease resistance RPP13-like protein 1 [Phaseolus vulgaris]|uniref:putative disease resistance RPP13-like protein 1 n=1 Tax=Phaseolus vulgaris TaxID=3885 RepID=UPI0035CC0DD3
MHFAFQNDNSKLNYVLKEIGMKIVEKCQRLTLALETIESLLLSKSFVSEWESVLRSNIWDLRIEDSKTIPALLLSYYHPPSHLKRCFAYCALFPKYHKFEKESLILSWMTQNFLQCSQQSESLEEIGEQYFNDLLSRLGVDRPGSVPKTTRHFSTVKMDSVEYDEYRSLCDAKRLRTFLSISTNCGISSWYLYIEILLDSMCSLCHLQVLKLNNCNLLKELPSTLHKLTKLRRLELKLTTLRKAPVLLGKLKNLQVWMDEFKVGKSSDESMDLKNKTHLVELGLEWDLKQNNEDSIKEREVLENLQTSRHLEKLSINGYGGTQFRLWLSDNSLLNVVSLTLKNCKHCQWLPSLGLLTFLKHLEIDGLDGIVRINANFYGNGSFAFASLETLKFTDIKEWEEWKSMTTAAFPTLQGMNIPIATISL